MIMKEGFTQLARREKFIKAQQNLVDYLENIGFVNPMESSTAYESGREPEESRSLDYGTWRNIQPSKEGRSEYVDGRAAVMVPETTEQNLWQSQEIFSYRVEAKPYGNIKKFDKNLRHSLERNIIACV